MELIKTKYYRCPSCNKLTMKQGVCPHCKEDVVVFAKEGELEMSDTMADMFPFRVE